MRHLTAVALVALGVLAMSSVALADHGDVAKPLCADISDANTGYGFDRIVTSQITTVEPTCKGITYSIVIEVEPGLFVTVSSRGNNVATSTGRGEVILRSAPITGDTDDMICVYVTSSRGGKDGANQLIDRFPDTGCTTIALGGSGGGIGHG
jgi:hypothetical protein